MMKKKKNKIEYLALPYSDESADKEMIMNFRAEISNIICAELMNQGRLVYAPISACHHIAQKYGLPRDWKFWRRLDEAFVKVCGRIIVITLKGWETSTGVQAELKLAKKHGLEIEYIDPEPYFVNFEDSILEYMKDKSVI
jgi:hypothetical protein